MGQITIYYNPRCSKSRQTLQLLNEQGIEPTVIEYLAAAPARSELEVILAMLGLEPRDLMRTKEAVYKELNLNDAALSKQQLINAMVENPILIERPIVINGDKAAIGRPPENILGIL